MIGGRGEGWKSEEEITNKTAKGNVKGQMNDWMDKERIRERKIEQ